MTSLFSLATSLTRCPRCNAVAGQPCRTPKGRACNAPHGERIGELRARHPEQVLQCCRKGIFTFDQIWDGIKHQLNQNQKGPP